MSKSKLAELSLVAVLTIGSTSALAAAPAKAGAKCAKAGQTQVIGHKKFTCTKPGSKLTWNKGVTVPAKATPTASATSSPAPALVKFENCAEARAAGAAPLTTARTLELYELNARLDRDKDGVACEN